MKEKDLYNGLDSDLNNFAKFLFIYEQIIKNLNNKESFKIRFRNTESYFVQKISKYLTDCSKNDIEQFSENKDLPKKGKPKTTFIFTGSKCQIIEFCRHLRNSFSHANIKVIPGVNQHNKRQFIIKDFSRQKYTAYGTLEAELVEQFIKQMIMDYTDF